MKRVVSVLLFIVSIGGCTSAIQEKSNKYDLLTAVPEICCSSYSDFSWTQLAKEEDVKFEIDPSSPVWQFPEGKSHFASFVFSEQSRTVDVTISSRMIDKTVFAPKVVSLDTHFNVVAEYKLENFKTLYSDAFDKNRYEISFSIDASKAPYLVVYTPSEQIGNKVIIPHPAKVRAIDSGAPLPIVTDLKYEHAYIGELDIEIETLSLNNTVKKKNSVKKVNTSPVQPQPESVLFYETAIKSAVKESNIPKALSLLEEAKALNIEGAQEAFVNAVNELKK